MALIEINLEEPALLESQTRTGGAETEKTKEASGSRRGKVLGLLVLVAGVSLLVWKLRSGDNEDGGGEFGVQENFEDAESGRSKGKLVGVLGLLVALVGVGAARKRRN